MGGEEKAVYFCMLKGKCIREDVDNLRAGEEKS